MQLRTVCRFTLTFSKNKMKGKEVKLSVITGDLGGGASVQQLHPKLIQNKTMCKYSKRLACDLHNMNKALEVACIETWDKQGIGHKTPYQMCWLWNKIFKLSREDLGRQGVNEAWFTMINNLRGGRNWQTTAINECRHAFEDFMKRLQELEEGNDDDLDLAIQMITKAPTNVKDPVFSRWESVAPSIHLFAEYWIVIYFFARTIAQMEKAGSYLKTLSCALLSLMYNSSMPSNDGDLLHLSNSMRAMTRYYQRIHCRRILRQYFWSSHISWTASIHGIIMVRSPSSTSVLCRLLYDMHAYHHR
jgi:hypothetical protein